MSLFPVEYGGSEGLIAKLRSLPAIEMADLERAAEVADQHLYLLWNAANINEAYHARHNKGHPYTELDFLIDAAAVYLCLGEFDWTSPRMVSAPKRV